MVLGLLTASLLSIIVFVITIVMGFTMQSGANVSQHILWGFFATFLVTLSQSMTMFYFIGTGKHVKDLVANRPTGNEFIRRTKVFKAKVFPPALWAMLFTMATMILGGGVHTRMIPTWVHTVLAAISLYYNVVAFWTDAKYMIQHNLLMEELERTLQTSSSAE
jgi:hypothetical protein